jgi:Zn finger protein HypA/HybF involved in hydrogenase expression
MHELTAIKRIVRQAEAAAREQGYEKVQWVTVRVGSLAMLSPEVLEGLYAEASRGTALEGAALRVERSSDLSDEAAGSLVLVSIDVQD